MNIPGMRALKRLAVGLVIAGSLGGCAVYGPPYAAAYDPYYYPSYAYPTYVGPPVALNFGFGYYDRGGYGPPWLRQVSWRTIARLAWTRRWLVAPRRGLWIRTRPALGRPGQNDSGAVQAHGRRTGALDVFPQAIV